MPNGNEGIGQGSRWRSVFVAAVATIATLWSTAAMATITQGDFSVFGYFESREGGRWGEGSSNNNATPTIVSNALPGVTTAKLGTAATTNGGSFDFNHWDLVEARQLADIRPDYHMVKNYSFLGRIDTLFLKDADFFGFYRPWYDAEGTLKNKGIAEPNTDALNYTHRQLQAQYFQNTFREYYAQMNFTDNFSMRVGKQQVIWSEADALSGTEVTNPVNTTWHGFEGAEAPEDTRTNLRMIKLNYIFPDFFQTANNELELFIIPGDFEGSLKVQTDPRNPWVAPAVLGAHFPLSINQAGQQLRVITLPEADDQAMLFNGGLFYDVALSGRSKPPSNSLQNSEFGGRYSTLLPIGNGLQVSLIFLYEYRDARSVPCMDCSAQEALTILRAQAGSRTHVLPIKVGPGEFIYPGVYTHPVRAGVPKAGLFQDIGETDYVRNKFFGMTGTYYDNDVTDIVFRYDFLYQPDHAIGCVGCSVEGSEWTQLTRWIIAGDRPTYIPWISKQHTFFTLQYTLTWQPDRPKNAASIVVAGLPAVGKSREVTNLAFLAVTNWLWNGQLTTGHVFTWDIDNNVGDFSAGYTFRYSRNVVLGMNMIWYLGRSGRITDPFLFSRSQRWNQLEATFTYEL